MSHGDELHALLGDLVQANARLVRIAAQTTGSTESSATWRTLRVLQQSGPLRIGELAALSRVAQPTMTKMVAGLAERGWVVRVPDDRDARAWQVDVTPDGAAAVEAWIEELTSALHPYFTDLTREEHEALRRTVRLLEERVQRTEPTGPPQPAEPTRSKELSH